MKTNETFYIKIETDLILLLIRGSLVRAKRGSNIKKTISNDGLFLFFINIIKSILQEILLKDAFLTFANF